MEILDNTHDQNQDLDSDSDMVSVKKPCNNSLHHTYTGKEVSPMGLGYTADAEIEGTIMKGRDDSDWIVGWKNNVKVWNRIPTELEQEEPVIMSTKNPPATEEPAPTKKRATKTAAKKGKESENLTKEPVAATTTVATAAATTVVEEIKPAAKKAASAKKPAAADAITTTVAEAPVKVKRPPNDYNIFVSYKVKHEKYSFQDASKEWGTLTLDQKAEVIARAKVAMA